MPGTPRDSLAQSDIWRIAQSVRLRLPRTANVQNPGRQVAAKRLGMDFLDFQAYAPGEDVRHVDWSLYARTRELYVRRYEDERSGRLVVLVDGSGSMLVSKGQKWARAFDIARAICCAALNHDHEVIVGCTGKGTAQWLSPQHGSDGFQEIYKFLGSYSPGGRSHIGAAIDGLSTQVRNGTLCIVTDLLSGDTGGGDLLSLDRWLGQIHVLRLTMPDEFSLDAGIVDDPESSRRFEVDEHALHGVRDRVQTYLGEIDSVLTELGIIQTRVDCGASAISALRMALAPWLPSHPAHDGQP